MSPSRCSDEVEKAAISRELERERERERELERELELEQELELELELELEREQEQDDMTTYPHIALAGYGRAGKDSVGAALIDGLGYRRIAMGDFIKQECDQVLREWLGISAWAEGDEKRIVRPFLERYGTIHAARFLRAIKAAMEIATHPLINTRIIRPEECQVWREGGGLIVEVQRPGQRPATDWEAHELERCRAMGLVDGFIINDGDLDKLRITAIDFAKSHSTQSQG